jgi:Zn-dependent protease
MLSFLHLETLFPRLFAFLIAMTLHDAAHAWTASILGDQTARKQGRLSLNPLVHLDALGLAMLLFGPYGWSKPVPVELANFSKKPRLFHTLVYAAGPLVNLLLVFFFWWLYFYIPSFYGNGAESITLETWKTYLQYGVIVNLMLCMIHLLPLYPLDGWQILRGWVPDRAQEWMQRNQIYALILTVTILVTPIGQWALDHLYPLAAHLVMNLFAY